VVKKETNKQIKVVQSERGKTTNLAEEVEEESVLLMMRCSSKDEHKQMDKSTRRLSVINQSNNTERSSRRVDNSESLAENVEISGSPKREVESSVEHVESSVEHEAILVCLVGSLNCLIKTVEQVEWLDCSGE